jgi:hypothetical protein
LGEARIVNGYLEPDLSSAVLLTIDAQRVLRCRSTRGEPGYGRDRARDAATGAGLQAKQQTGSTRRKALPSRGLERGPLPQV